MFFRIKVFSLVLLSIFTLIVFFIFPNASYAKEEYIEYKVLKNDTLIKVLKKHYLKPIYGKSGSLEEALRLNPQKQKTQGNLILIGEVLILPKNMDLVKNKIEMPKLITTTENNLKKNQNIKKIGIQKQVPNTKESTIIKETVKIPQSQPQVIFEKKNTFNKLEPERQNDLVKSKEQKNEFIPNNKNITEKVSEFNSNNQYNNLKEQSDYLTLSKTQLPALQLKANSVLETKETTITQYQEINSTVGMEYEILSETLSYCNPNPSCKIRL